MQLHPNDLPQFRGSDDEDVQYWLRKLEHFFLAAACDDARRKLGYALCALHGLAESYGRAKHQQSADYDEFKQEILRQHPCNVSSIVSKLERLQQMGALVQNYTQDFQGQIMQLPNGHGNHLKRTSGRPLTTSKALGFGQS